MTGDYLDKQVRTKLGMNDADNEKKGNLEKLQQEMLDARNRYNIENFNRMYKDLKNKK